MVWRIALTDQAHTDLETVVAFLAKKSSAAAEIIGIELLDLVFSLERFPNRGARARHRPGLRKLAHRHYLVIYRVNASTSIVEIIRIWDNRQDPQRFRLP